MNAALPGTKMPVIGIGTGAYVHEPGTQPGEIWTDEVAEKAVSQWLALGGRRIDAAYNYHNQIGVGTRGTVCCVKSFWQWRIVGWRRSAWLQ